MKKVAILITLLSALFLVGVVNSIAVEVISFENSFTRGKGAPVVKYNSFPGIAGDAVLRIFNGSEDDTLEKASSAVISVNGVNIITHNNFNQQVGYIEIPAILSAGENTLTVMLMGKPGTKIRVEIVQDVDADGAAFIGPEGGMVEVTDPYSLLSGVVIEVPSNIVNESALFTINSVPTNIIPPDNNLTLGKVLINCDKELNGFVKIEFPIEINESDNNNIIIAYFDDQNGIWGFLQVIEINNTHKFIEFFTNHFTSFFIQKFESNNYEAKMTEFDVQSDCFNENYSNTGVCLGMATFSKWYFLNYGHGLRCKWNKDNSGIIASLAHDVVYKSWLSLSVQHINFIGTKNLLLYSLDLGIPQVLQMKRVFSDDTGHAIDVIGYKKTDSNNIEFYCYDVNYPMVIKTVYCSGLLGIWSFYNPTYPDYNFFFASDVGCDVHPCFQDIIAIIPADDVCDEKLLIEKGDRFKAEFYLNQSYPTFAYQIIFDFTNMLDYGEGWYVELFDSLNNKIADGDYYSSYSHPTSNINVGIATSSLSPGPYSLIFTNLEGSYTVNELNISTPDHKVIKADISLIK